MCQADDGVTGEVSSSPSAPLQSDDSEDAEEEEGISTPAFFGVIGVLMFAFCPIIAIVDNVAGILAFLVGVVMFGMAEWTSRIQSNAGE